MSDIKLYQGDCLEIMKQISDKSIDMILCDLPYGTTACKWDTIIPFDKLWEQYKRIRKDNAPIVLFASEPFGSALVMSNVKEFREEIIWLKNRSGSAFRPNQKHIKIHEKIYIFSKDGNYTFNPQKWLVSEKDFLTQRRTFKETEVGNQIYGKIKRVPKEDVGERNPLSIVSCKVPFNPQKRSTYSSDVDVRIHPTQKPLKLLEYLIKTFSNIDELVLDNCIGSGTTGVACKLLNRNFIGIELDENYFKIAKERIDNTIVPKRLF